MDSLGFPSSCVTLIHQANKIIDLENKSYEVIIDQNALPSQPLKIQACSRKNPFALLDKHCKLCTAAIPAQVEPYFMKMPCTTI